MLETEFRTMLEYVSNNRKAFKQLYKKGYFSYSKDGNFIGEAAIVNNKAVVAFLQEANNENHVVASTNFEEGANLIYKLSGDNFSLKQFGKSIMNMGMGKDYYTSKTYNPDKAGIIRDINSVRIHCKEAREKAEKQLSLSSKLFKKSSSDERLSKKQVISLLEKTITKLPDRSQTTEQKHSRAEISPKVEISHAVAQNMASQDNRSIDNDLTK